MPKFNLYQSLHTTVIGPGGQGRSRCRSAPARCTSAPSGASPRTGRTRTTAPSHDIDWLNRIIDWQAEVSDPAQFMENLKTDLEQDEVFVFTPKGRVITLPVGSTTGRLRLRGAHRGRPRVHRRQGQRAPRVARPPAAQRRHLRDLHVEGRDRRPVAGLARLRRVAAGAQQDPAVVQPRAPRRHDRGRGATSSTEEFRREGLPVQQMWTVRAARPRSSPSSATPTSTRCWPRSASTTSRRAASPSGSLAAFRDGDDARAAAGDGVRARAAIAQPATTRSACTSRVSTTCSSACRQVLHAGARRRDHRLRHPWAGRQRAPRRLRQRRVA